MTDEQFATAIDCEGYIGIYRSFDARRKRHGYSARVSLGMTHPAIPNALVARFGSRVYVHQKIRHYQACYNWVVQNREQVTNVLESILPYLVVKQLQAENVMGFIRHCESNPPSWNGQAIARADTDVLESYWRKAKALNHPAPATTERENLEIGCDSLNITGNCKSCIRRGATLDASRA